MTETALGVGSGVRTEESVTTAQRIAGAILIVNALSVVAETVLFPTDDPFANPYVSSTVDVFLGGLLIARKAGAIGWVKLRLVLGAILFTALHAFRGDPLMAGLQLCFSGGLAALMFGEAGKVRATLGLAAVSVLLALQGAGFQQHLTGRNALTPLLMRLTGDLAPLDGGAVTGDQVPFTFENPGPGWQRRSNEGARADNPLADTWLVHPEFDAHLMVIAEELPEPVLIPLADFAANVVENAMAAAADFEVRSETPLELENGEAQLVEATAEVEGTRMRFYYGLFSFEGYAFQVVCFANEQSFRRVRGGMRKAILSFAFAPQG